MNEYTDCETARSIMGNDFIGISDICTIKNMKLDVEKIPQEIPYSIKTINEKKGDYILLPGVSRFTDGKFVTIRNMVRLFGKDPTIFEPCFYNQDWYEKESFIDTQAARNSSIHPLPSRSASSFGMEKMLTSYGSVEMCAEMRLTS